MEKVELALFFDYRGVLLVEFIHGKKRINFYDYIDTLMWLYIQIKHITARPLKHLL